MQAILSMVDLASQHYENGNILCACSLNVTKLTLSVDREYNVEYHE